MQQNSQRHLRDTEALKRAWNGHSYWSIVRLWLRHLRFESLYLCQEKTDIRTGVCFSSIEEDKDSKNRYYEQSE